VGLEVEHKAFLTWQQTKFETIRLNRLRWFGHVQRMKENRIPSIETVWITQLIQHWGVGGGSKKKVGLVQWSFSPEC
jgi:hypothetical protein